MGRSQVVAAVALGALQLLVLVSLAFAGPTEQPQDAPIRINAPNVVSTFLIDRVEALPGDPLDAQALATPAAARRSVEKGRSVAAVVVDLKSEQDTLYVAGANGAALNRDVLEIVEELEAQFGRSAVVRDLVPAEEGGRGTVYALAGVPVVSGFIVAVVITWLGGPVPRTMRAGARRIVVVAAIAVVGGGVFGIVAHALGAGEVVTWWLLAAAVLQVCAMTTLALESVFGVMGIGAASALFVLTAAPLLRLTHPLLLPEPWATLTPWLPHGASLEMATGEAYFGGSDLRPMLVLAVWGALAVVTMIDARRERESQQT